MTRRKERVMAGTTKPDFKPGDRVVAYGVPYSWKSSKAKVLSEPTQTDKGGWVVAIQYWYIGERTRDIVSTDSIVKIRSIKVKKSAIVTAIVLGFMAIIGLWLAGNYNSLVQANNAVDNSKAKIDTQLERRYELIDNIVASVKGSQAQESDVFGKIAEARKIGGQSGNSPEQAANANAAIDQQIALLPRLQEAYPELRSNDQVTRLIQELQGTAGQVASARDNYNNTVTNYNTNITSFPKNIFAGMFNFQKKELFKASKAAETNPKVDLNRE